MKRLRGVTMRLLASADTRRAAGLASAVISANFVALGFTIVFARTLGASRYGSLAALLSTFIILMVPGSALQTTVAREVSGAVASGDPSAGASVRRWLGRLLIATVAITVVSVLCRDLIAGRSGSGSCRGPPRAPSRQVPCG